jgi:pilus assembly protein Flp/PilA
MKANILRTLRNLHKDESGQDLVEYALAAALIALAATATMSSLGTAVNTAFSTVSSTLTNAV